ncbi:MAG: response regulator [Nitrospirae bacterium]|nr:response regulator [Nitrospirota bacterium]NTW65167.1 response regulator [Nitrospirota bacterium]
MKKILIVDDEDLIRYSLSSLFRDPHAEVFSVATGKAALDTLQNHPVELCFLDIHLPDMNGLDIMRTLRDISPRTRIIIMTGSLITGEIMRRIQEHAHCLISKPFDLEQVGSAAARLLTAHVPLHREDRLDTGSNESSIVWMDGNWRKHPRMPVRKSITCHAVDPQGKKEPVLVNADVLDTSGSGMCIETPHALEPGYLVQLEDAPTPGSGVVRWRTRSAAMETYRTGIQLIAPENIPMLMRSADIWRAHD